MADLSLVNKQIADARERAIWMPLLHPLTGEVIGGPDKPVEWQLLSAECKAYRAAERAFQAQRTLSKANGDKWAQRDLDANEEHNLNKLVLVTQNWRNVEEDGELLACSPANIRRMLAYDWVFSQVFIQVHTLTDYGIEGEAPTDIIGDAEKKLETGQDGTSPSEAASDLVQ